MIVKITYNCKNIAKLPINNDKGLVLTAKYYKRQVRNTTVVLPQKQKNRSMQ